jgi:hypothetical protein
LLNEAKSLAIPVDMNSMKDLKPDLIDADDDLFDRDEPNIDQLQTPPGNK